MGVEMPSKTSPSAQTADDLGNYRKQNLAWLLLRVRQDFFERAREGWRKRGYLHLQNSFGTVITHLPLEGARLTDLAESAGVTKQAMGQLVDELEKLGYLERVADPTDGRAKMVRFTKKGVQLVADGREVVAEVWAEYEDLVGARRLQRLRDDLDVLVASIDAEDDLDVASGGS
jgi:DNA-binding MarR family transcriptional regulator